MFADFGAEVIKVEQPGIGDYWRWMQPKVQQHGSQFLALNRGKSSITLDLKQPAGRDAFLKLCEKADIVIEGFRPGVMARLGLDSATLQARNSKLIYCSLSGFGQDGPNAQVAAHDLNYLGMTGVLNYLNGRSPSPRATALPVADIGAGALMAIAGILAALVERERGGDARTVEISITDGLLSWLGFMTSQWNVPGSEAEPIPFDAPFDKPFFTIYETGDGRHLVVGAYEPKFWATLCEVLCLQEWVERQWVEGVQEEELRSLIATAFRNKPLAHWIDVFSRHEACVTPVLTVKEALNTPHARARGSVISVTDPIEGELKHIACPIRFDGIAPNSLNPSPTLGSATDALLYEAGFTSNEIEKMKATGAI